MFEIRIYKASLLSEGRSVHLLTRISNFASLRMAASVERSLLFTEEVYDLSITVFSFRNLLSETMPKYAVKVSKVVFRAATIYICQLVMSCRCT